MCSLPGFDPKQAFNAVSLNDVITSHDLNKFLKIVPVESCDMLVKYFDSDPASHEPNFIDFNR